MSVSQSVSLYVFIWLSLGDKLLVCSWGQTYLSHRGGGQTYFKHGGANIFTYMGGHTFLYTRGMEKHFHTRVGGMDGGKHFYTQGGGQTFSAGVGSGDDDVVEMKDEDVSEASKLFSGARTLRGP